MALGIFSVNIKCIYPYLFYFSFFSVSVVQELNDKDRRLLIGEWTHIETRSSWNVRPKKALKPKTYTFHFKENNTFLSSKDDVQGIWEFQPNRILAIQAPKGKKALRFKVTYLSQDSLKLFYRALPHEGSTILFVKTKSK